MYGNMKSFDKIGSPPFTNPSSTRYIKIVFLLSPLLTVFFNRNKSKRRKKDYFRIATVGMNLFILIHIPIPNRLSNFRFEFTIGKGEKMKQSFIPVEFYRIQRNSQVIYIVFF